MDGEEHSTVVDCPTLSIDPSKGMSLVMTHPREEIAKNLQPENIICY